MAQEKARALHQSSEEVIQLAMRTSTTEDQGCAARMHDFASTVAGRKLRRACPRHALHSGIQKYETLQVLLTSEALTMELLR